MVQAGKPVEIIFENNDLMPHNFVVPNRARWKRSARWPRRPRPTRAPARGITCRTRRNVASEPAVAAARNPESQLRRPDKPGIYPYVCTYPGHWRRMYGAIYVVADLDEYLADPEGYMAKHPLQDRGSTVEVHRPRKEWKFEELAAVGRTD